MKTTLLTSTLLLAAAPAAMADPFTARPLPAGFSVASAYIGGSVDTAMVHEAQAVDFRGDGGRQWYAGGTTVSDFPGGTVTTLPAVTPPAGGSTLRSLAGIPCDVDRDGDLDIVRVNGWSGTQTDTFQVFLNNGSGAFTAGFRTNWTHAASLGFDEGAHHYDLAAADTDGDGDTDVVVTQSYANPDARDDVWIHRGRVYIMLNDGTGQFPASSVLEASQIGPRSRCSAADYDRDGDADVLVGVRVTDSTSLHIFITSSRLHRNNGSGTFAVSDFTFTADTFVEGTGDGWLDMVSGYQLSINNDGVPGSVVVLAGSPAKKAWAMADTGGDGIPDFSFGQGNALMRETGSGTPATVSTLAAEIVALAAADGDADGDVDYFVTLANGASVFLENQALHMQPGAYIAGSESRSGITGLHAADFNNDGREDLLAVTPAGENLWFMFGEADGIPAAGVFKLTQSEAPHSAAVADFDRDGRVDVAYTLPGNGEVRMARNTGNVPFSWADTAIATGLAGVTLCVPGQLGAPDGLTDVLTANGATGQLRWLTRSSGTWSAQDVVAFSAPPPGAIAAAKFDASPGDGVCLLAANASTHVRSNFSLNTNFNIWSQSGATQTASVVGGPHTARMIWADMGRLGRGLQVFINNSGGISAHHPTLGTSFQIASPGAAIRDIAAVDWNSDGFTDILCATATGLELAFYNRVTGNWDRTPLLTAAGGYTKVTGLDLNRDRYRDAAVTDGTQIHYVRNRPHVLSAAVSSGDVALPAGRENNGALLHLSTAGQTLGGTWLNDVTAIATGVNLSFHRAIASGGGYIRGVPLTKAEITAVASSIALTGNNSVIGSTGSANFNDGQVSVLYNTALGTQVPVAAGASIPHGIRFTVPSGALSAPVTRFIMTVNSLFGEELNGQNPVIPGGTLPVRLTGDTQIVLTIVPEYTLIQQWRQTYFGTPNSTGIAANNADPDGDRIPNLIEYISGRDPHAPAMGLGPVMGLTLEAGTGTMVADLLLLTTYDSKVRLTLQYSLNPAAGWSQFSTRTGTGAWSLPPIRSVLLFGGNGTRFEFDGGSPAIFPKAFYRLKAEELP